MPHVSMKELLEAGVHFGHQTRRWNPKMRPYIYGGRNGIYIVDLHKTLVKIEEAYEAIRNAITEGGSVLFVGTKKQAQESVQSAADRCGMYYVNQRWLGGMLTNLATIRQRIRKLREYEELMASDSYERLPKTERQNIEKERGKLERYLTGIKDMARLPSMIFIVDLKKEHIAVLEAKKLEIPVVAIVDTNCDPDEATYPIPGNDDAIRAIRLICNMVADASLEGQRIREKANETEEAVAGEAPVEEGSAFAEVEAEMAGESAAAETALDNETA